MLEKLHILSFSHKKIHLRKLGELIISEEELKSRLISIKEELHFEELLYVGTCNRVEFAIVSNDQPNVSTLLQHLFPDLSKDSLEFFKTKVIEYQSEDAVKHYFDVVSSLDSLVVGEKEITSQVKEAYEKCNSFDLTGDVLRMLQDQAIQVSKAVFSQTKIAENPVSVVSLAYRELREINKNINSKFLIIGAGQTNKLMAKYLLKHGYKNFSVFNRTLANAESLAEYLNGDAYQLDSLNGFSEDFDVIITCTASPTPVITNKLYQKLSNKGSEKVIIDLAVPGDVEESVSNSSSVKYISIENLEIIAEKNKAKREKEIGAAQKIIAASILEFEKRAQKREVELAMKAIPDKIKEIRATAIDKVYAEKVGKLDDDSKALLDDILNYMEKKYISVPMKMAKEILVEK
ncbi:MAG: glutamyl-tRNA reductase [Bacteroidia bacterium]|nr:glutamyl-tRNA reductase [Bacteroidia bacterium]MBN4052116.1 glutamyl-tRNA reductase [Sphingobacteriaceae bacterium AH-315-L07]